MPPFTGPAARSLVLSVVLAAACGGSTSSSGGDDAGSRADGGGDVGVSEGGTDAGGPEAGAPETSAPETSVPETGAEAGAGEAGSASCSGASDCRLFSNYCGGCACDALGPGEPDPTCDAGLGSCLVDPCSGRVAACDATHHCAAQ